MKEQPEKFDPVSTARQQSDTAREFAGALMEQRVDVDAVRALDQNMQDWVTSYFDFRVFQTIAIWIAGAVLVFLLVELVFSGWEWIAAAIAFALFGLRQVPRTLSFLQMGRAVRRAPKAADQ